ncbi:unnamed protein product [Schistosoma mattheei]|uniref:Uncharacterized protein n=1 Tax=Schistosoma mattheei TaxID=31246 RepID=A0AA85BE28_9TREM|nr:unnamed protein product [Schistosoma mattheei]
MASSQTSHFLPPGKSDTDSSQKFISKWDIYFVKSYTVLHTEESIFEKRESIALGFDLLFWNIRKINKLV